MSGALRLAVSEGKGFQEACGECGLHRCGGDAKEKYDL